MLTLSGFDIPLIQLLWTGPAGGISSFCFYIPRIQALSSYLITIQLLSSYLIASYLTTMDLSGAGARVFRQAPRPLLLPKSTLI